MDQLTVCIVCPQCILLLARAAKSRGDEALRRRLLDEAEDGLTESLFLFLLNRGLLEKTQGEEICQVLQNLTMVFQLQDGSYSNDERALGVATGCADLAKHPPVLLGPHETLHLLQTAYSIYDKLPYWHNFDVCDIAGQLTVSYHKAAWRTCTCNNRDICAKKMASNATESGVQAMWFGNYHRAHHCLLLANSVLNALSAVDEQVDILENLEHFISLYDRYPGSTCTCNNRIAVPCQAPENVWIKIVKKLSEENNWAMVRELMKEKVSADNALSGAAEGLCATEVNIQGLFRALCDEEMASWGLDLAATLLERGASVDTVRTKYDSNPTAVALKFGLRFGCLRLLDFLLKLPGDRDKTSKRNFYGDTLLHLVVNTGMADTSVGVRAIALLLEHGVRPDIPDRNGKLPLEYMNPTDQMYDFLLKKQPKLGLPLASRTDPRADPRDLCSSCMASAEKLIRKGRYSLALERLCAILSEKWHHSTHKSLSEAAINHLCRDMGQLVQTGIPPCMVQLPSGVFRRVVVKMATNRQWRSVASLINARRHAEPRSQTMAKGLQVTSVINCEDLHTEIKSEIISVLLKNGANLKTSSGKAEDPVKVAVDRKEFRLIPALIHHGCSPANIGMGRARPPLHLALEVALDWDKGYFELFENLLELFDKDNQRYSYLNPSRVDEKGNTLLDVVANYRSSCHTEWAVFLMSQRGMTSTKDHSIKQVAQLTKESITSTKDHSIKEVVQQTNESMTSTKDHSIKQVVQQIKESMTSTKDHSIKQVVQQTKESMTPGRPSSQRTKSVKQSRAPALKNRRRTKTQSKRGREQKSAAAERSPSWSSRIIIADFINHLTQDLAEEKTHISPTKSGKDVLHLARETCPRSVAASSVCDENIDHNGSAVASAETSLSGEALLEIDAGVFEGLEWEVECTAEVWKALKDKKVPLHLKQTAIQKIQQLCQGDWTDSMTKAVRNVSGNLKLFEAKISKDARILWELAISFSPRLSRGQLSAARYYSEIVRLWDIVLDHDELSNRIQQVDKSFKKSKKCLRPTNLSSIPASRPSPNSNVAKRLPQRFTRASTEHKADVTMCPPGHSEDKMYNIIKFYDFSSDVVHQILQETDAEIDFPFKPTDSEHDIINLPQDSPILLLGRSGTGKTVCLLHRLWHRYKAYRNDPLYLELRCHQKNPTEATGSCTLLEESLCLHQVFVTKNSILCNEIRKKFQELRNGCYDLNGPSGTNASLPRKLQRISSQMYPLFLNFRQLLLMLDSSLPGKSFFERSEDGALKEDIDGWTDVDISLVGVSDAWPLGGVTSMDSVDRIPAMRKSGSRREVTYDVFLFELWPKIKKKSQFHPSLVWTEIFTFIKGSFQSVLSEKGFLTLDEYEEVGKKCAPNFTGNRSDVYEIFTTYEREKKRNGIFDECDLLLNIHRRLDKEKMFGWKVDEMYVDETQDFTPAELSLLIKLCENPNRMFLSGDTAQAIMRGISFRFTDVKSLFYQIQDGVTVPTHQLTDNYRSHQGILSLASSIVDLLVKFFPESFDVVDRDRGVFPGPLPILLELSSSKDLTALLTGNQCETSEIEFGAHQAILVVNDEARKNIPKELQSGLVLTIEESKGLEFDDILLYNFFKESIAGKEWRVVTYFLQHFRQSEAIQASACRPLAFDGDKHRVLCSEFKRLYTAITRARVRLWIYDEDEKKRSPVFDYFKANSLVRTVTSVENGLKAYQHEIFGQRSSSTDWTRRGDEFMERQLYDMAIKCYQKAGDRAKENVATAHNAAHRARGLQSNESKMREGFLKAAELYLVNSGMVAEAAQCLAHAKESLLAARLYGKCGQMAKAGQLYKLCGQKYYESWQLESQGLYKQAVQVLCETNSFDVAIDVVDRYNAKVKEYLSAGKPVPVSLLENKPDHSTSELREKAKSSPVRDKGGKITGEDQAVNLPPHPKQNAKGSQVKDKAGQIAGEDQSVNLPSDPKQNAKGSQVKGKAGQIAGEDQAIKLPPDPSKKDWRQNTTRGHREKAAKQNVKEDRNVIPSQGLLQTDKMHKFESSHSNDETDRDSGKDQIYKRPTGVFNTALGDKATRNHPDVDKTMDSPLDHPETALRPSSSSGNVKDEVEQVLNKPENCSFLPKAGERKIADGEDNAIQRRQWAACKKTILNPMATCTEVKNKHGVSKELTQLLEYFKDVKDFSEACEVQLLLGQINEDVNMIEIARQMFGSFDPESNEAGQVECSKAKLKLINLAQSSETCYKFASQDLACLFKALRISHDTSDDSEKRNAKLYKYLKYYGLEEDEQDGMLVYEPRQSPKCLSFLKGDSKENRLKISVHRTQQKFYGYLLQLAGDWIVAIRSAVHDIQGEYGQCPEFAEGRPCNLLLECSQFHEPFTKETFLTSFFCHLTLAHIDALVLSTCDFLRDAQVALGRLHPWDLGTAFCNLICFLFKSGAHWKLFATDTHFLKSVFDTLRQQGLVLSLAWQSGRSDYCKMGYTSTDTEQCLWGLVVLSDVENTEFWIKNFKSRPQGKSGPSRAIVKDRNIDFFSRFYVTVRAMYQSVSDPLDSLKTFDKFWSSLLDLEDFQHIEQILFFMEYFLMAEFCLGAKHTGHHFIVPSSYMAVVNFVDKCFADKKPLVHIVKFSNTENKDVQTSVARNIARMVESLLGKKTGQEAGKTTLLQRAFVTKAISGGVVSGVADRFWVLCLTLVSNVSWLVPESCQDRILLSLHEICERLPQQEWPPRLVSALSRTFRCRGQQDVVEALSMILREQNQEELLVCRWVDGARDATQSLRVEPIQHDHLTGMSEKFRTDKWLGKEIVGREIKGPIEEQDFEIRIRGGFMEYLRCIWHKLF